MANRREFLKTAGILGITPWSNELPFLHAQAATPREFDSPAKGTSPATATPDSVILENSEIRLLISPTGSARSLLHKPTGQECLVQNVNVPMFALTQYRPYINEVQLAYPAKVTQFHPGKVRREGNDLYVSFPLLGYEALIGLTINDAYIAFRFTKLIYKGFHEPYVNRTATPIDESLFVQLPVRNRNRFGEWLNVVWDQNVAVNLLAVDAHTRIDSDVCSGYRLLKAGTVAEVQLEGASAALITTTPQRLLDCIDRVEHDFDLPRGVESRRRKEYRSSYYEVLQSTPGDVDEHIRFATMGGFRLMQVYHLAFTNSLGHFPWRPEYSRGILDVQEMVSKIEKAGIIPGFHVLYSMTTTNDSYVTPTPDPRLSLRRSFTLAQSIDASANTIQVLENPKIFNISGNKRILADSADSFPDQEKMQVLRIQNELIQYQSYTFEPPFRFLGCVRGALGSAPSKHDAADRVGLLDMYSPKMVRYSQDTDIQAEVSARLQEIYQKAGFKFLYFDGAEDVPAPYWYNVSRAQMILQSGLKPQPLFGEGACKSHFSWHMLTRGNAFDTFPPELQKAATRAYCVEEIGRVVNDFSSIDFGWLDYRAPGKDSMGTQPDVLEYVTSVAAAWDCTIALFGKLDELKAHPRTPDNLEVLKRWEDVRAQGWLTEAQKLTLRNVNQEYTLLIDRQGQFVLAPYDQIEHVAGADGPARAFLFEFESRIWVTYWHVSGEGFLDIPAPPDGIALMKNMFEPLAAKAAPNSVTVPLGEKRYLRFDRYDHNQVVAALQKARLHSV